MKITIETIPHLSQRYPTLGDWQFDKEGNLNIKVSQELKHKSFILVAIHELIEAILCDQDRITEDKVDAFDMNYNGPFFEPGEDPRCPYHKQHHFAEIIEKLTANQIDFPWGFHENECTRVITS